MGIKIKIHFNGVHRLLFRVYFTLIMHAVVQLHVPVLLGPLVANGVSHLMSDHSVRAMHFDAILLHFSRYTTNALRKGHVHVNGLDAAVWWHFSRSIHDLAAIRVTFSIEPNAQMNCIDGVLYALHSVSNDAF